MLAVHISIMAPFLTPPSKLKYTDKEYWCVIIHSLVTKSILFPVLFSLSPLILLYLLLFIFIFGNSPIVYFQPNMKCFHDFHLHLHHLVIPQLIDTFNGNKSLLWIRQFVYLLFNCAILDEYITKKSNPQSQTRVSFVNLLAGNDVDKVLKRVSTHLEDMMTMYDKYGNLNHTILQCNRKSWRNTFEWATDDTIQSNFQYILCVLFPFHLVLFWMYLMLNNDSAFTMDSLHIITIGGAQLLFYILATILLWIHLEYTVKKKPQSLYTWSNYNLMDFYCSFHDDDEQDSFKMKLQSYMNLFATEYRTSRVIRINKRFTQKWFADTIISFCCVMNDTQYDEHSYNAVMSIVSRTTRAQHSKQSSSKQAILRSYLRGSFSDTGRAGAYEFSPPVMPMHSTGWSQDSVGSVHTQSSFRHKSTEEEKDAGCCAISEESNVSNKSSSTRPMFEMNALSEVDEMPGIDEGDEKEKEYELAVTPAPDIESETVTPAPPDELVET
eukprot:57733_1